MIKVRLPEHLATLAGTERDIEVSVDGTPTQRTIVDTIENSYPMLRGTIRDHQSLTRRPFIRFFACNRDLSHESIDAAVPQEVIDGKEPFLIIGAMAGG